MVVQRDWLLLSEVQLRLAARTFVAACDIIGRGQVPVTAVRSDMSDKTPQPVEALLAKAIQQPSIIVIADDLVCGDHEEALGAISPRAFDNEISALFDSRNSAIFGPRSELINMELYPQVLYVEVKFLGARVHWPALVKELAAIGLSADAGPDDASAPPGSGAERHNLEIAAEPAAAAGSAVASSEGSSGAPSTPDRLRPATDEQIRGAITAVYNQAKTLRNKAPNIRELPGPVQEELRRTGNWASGNQIMKIGEEKAFADRRWPIGKTVASQKRKTDFTK